MIQVNSLQRDRPYEVRMLTETIQHFYNEDREHLDPLLVEFDRAKSDNFEEAPRILGNSARVS